MVLVEGDAEVLGRILSEPREDLLVHGGDTARRVEETLTRGVFTHTLKDQSDALLDFLSVHGSALQMSAAIAGFYPTVGSRAVDRRCHTARTASAPGL
jgi:hypothetical protein